MHDVAGTHVLIAMLNRAAKCNLGDDVLNKVLLMAISNGCVKECDAAIKKVLVKGALEQDFTSKLERVFKPIHSSGGRNWSSVIAGVPTGNVEGREKLEGKNIKPDRKWFDGRSHEIRFSPNVLSMFLEMTVFPIIALCLPN